MGQAMFAEMAAAMLAAATPAASAETGQRALAQACEGRDGWSDAAPPARIHGSTYYVGTCGITVLLIATPDGHVMIDGATEQAAPHVLANIRKLGFDPRDVKLIVSTHEHIDHVGGLAALKAATGAKLVARMPARAALASGRADPDDPQAAILPPFTGVAVDRIVRDGEVVRLGRQRLTVHATPGHTSGGTSWSWRSCDSGKCQQVVYADSLNASSADGYRFADHPERVAPLRASIAKVAALDCGLLLSPHPSASAMFERFAGNRPLAESDACRAYAAAAGKRLDDRLASEVE